MKKFLISLATAVLCLPTFANEWQAVTSVSELKAGDEYLIVCPSKSKVMGDQNGSYRNALDVTVSNGELSSVPYNAAIVTLEPDGTGWNLRVSDGYLSYSGSNNYVYTTSTSCKFSISVSEDVTTIVPANVTTRKLQYNASAPRFACYTTNQTAIQLYRRATSNSRNPGIAFTERTYNANLYGSNTFPSLYNPENLDVTYASSYEDVATIDAEGNITLLAEGTTTISAKFEGNDEFDACEVSYSLFVSDYRKPTYISFPEIRFGANLYRSNDFPKLSNPYNVTIIYTSSNEAVAIIDKDGNISLLSEGETMISAKFEGNGEYYADETSYILTVTDPREQAEISFAEEEFLANLYGTTIFPKLTNPHNLPVIYSSSNESVATIATNGKVTLSAEGETTISTKFEGNNDYHAGGASYTLTVTDPRVYSGISFPEKEFTVRLGKVFDSPVLLNPNNVAVTYKSSNENVATVDAEGKVTLVGEGATNIIATSADTHSFKATTAEYSLNVVNPTIILDDSSLYTITDDGYAELKYRAMYQSDVINVVIPDNVTIDGTTYQVGSIGNYAFCLCELLESVKLPVNLQRIGMRAFSGCKSLQSIDIPESVTIIYEAAFRSCHSLTRIKFPDSLDHFYRVNGESPIENCTGLTEVILPNNKRPEDSMKSSWHSDVSSFLKGCTSIKEIVFPDNVDRISDDFFSGNNSIEKITIGKSLSNFPSSIMDLSSFKDLEISDENPYFIKDGHNLYLKWSAEPKSVCTLVFMREVPNDGVLRLIDRTTDIQFKTLRGKTLKEIIFPSSTTGISSFAHSQLYECKVGKLVIPENIGYIGQTAFRYSDIDTLIIAAADTPLRIDFSDSNSYTGAAFLGSKIRNLIINRDIDNNPNNTSWAKPTTRAFYQSTVNNLEINVSLGENARGLFSDASISNIKIGENVERLYALGCFAGRYNMEIYALGELEAPFNINNGPLNGGYEYRGFWPKNSYVYPSEIDRYKQILNGYADGYRQEVYPLPGCVSILLDEFSKTVRPEDEFVIGCKTYPDDFEIKWTSSNPAVATVSDNGEVTALSNGVARIIATGAQAGYTDASTSMLVYVSEDAPIEPSEAYLTMKGLSNHAIRHTYKAGTNAEINILPEDDWYVHSVTLNGEDISNALEDNKITTPKLFGENEMNVVLLKNGTTYVNEKLKANNINIRCSGNNVTVLGAENSDEVRVFKTNGECVYNGTDKTIALSAGTVYILKVKSSVFKFML